MAASPGNAPDFDAPRPLSRGSSILTSDGPRRYGPAWASPGMNARFLSRSRRMRPFVLGLVSALAATAPARALEPIPDRLVVLTFDDSSRSHIAVAAPVLKKHGFGAT